MDAGVKWIDVHNYSV